MTLKFTDTIIGKSRGSIAAAMAYAKKQGARRQNFLADYLAELWRLCTTYGFAFEYLVGQSKNETAAWTSAIWQQYGNPAGLAVTNSQNLSVVYENGTDAARAHVVHWYAYRYGRIPESHELYAYRALDGHYDAVFTTKDQRGVPLAGSVTTIADLNMDGRWALLFVDDYGNRVLRDTRAVFGELPDQQPFDPPVTTPSTPPEPVPGEQETPVTVPQYLDYSSLSFPVEVRFIPASQTMQRPGYAMAPARTTWHDTGNPGARTNAESHARWMAAGCPDANGNPTYTSWHFTVDDGRAIQHIPLNEVAWHAGDGSNGPGNRTSIAIEECVNSDRNAAKTRANAAELHAFLIRELKLQGGTVNGCVQHNYWSGKNCPEVIRNAGLWPEMQRQMTARLGSTPTTPVYAEAAPIAKGSQVINGYVFLAPGGKTVQADVVPVKYADKDQPATGPALKKGTKLTQDQIGHYVVGTDGALWVELVDVPGVQNGSRIPALALIAA